MSTEIQENIIKVVQYSMTLGIVLFLLLISSAGHIAAIFIESHSILGTCSPGDFARIVRIACNITSSLAIVLVIFSLMRIKYKSLFNG